MRRNPIFGHQTKIEFQYSTKLDFEQKHIEICSDSRKRIQPFKKYDKSIFMGQQYQASYNPSNVRKKTLSNFKGKSKEKSKERQSKLKVGQTTKVNIKSITNTVRSEFAVGILTSQNLLKQRIYGTAFLVGKRLLMTAAHNVFSDKDQHKNIKFIPSQLLGQQQRFGGISAKNVCVPQGYKTLDINKAFKDQEAYSYDYALIELQTELNLQSYFGSFGYDLAWQKYSPFLYNDKQIDKVSIMGFPVQDKPQYTIYNGNALLTEEYPKHLVHIMQTSSGVSGSPMICQEQNKWNVIAIHVKSINIEQKAAIKLRPGMFQQFKDFMIRTQRTYYFGNQSDSYSLENFIRSVHQNQQQKKHIGMDFRKAYEMGYSICSQLKKYQWRQLTSLNLSGNKIGADGCKILVTVNCKKLLNLNLRMNLIGNDGCYYLSINNHWQQLQILDLSDNQIEDIGCSRLKQSKFYSLQELHLYQNKITPQCQKQLQKKKQWFVMI